MTPPVLSRPAGSPRQSAAAPKPAAVAAPPTTEHFQGNRITISICKVSAQQLDFHFDRNDRVKKVKEKIQDEFSISFEQQRLIVGNRILSDCEMLSSIPGNEDGVKIQLTLFIRSKEVVEAIKRVQNNGLALQYVSEELKADREVVMAAVKQNGVALQFATQELQRDTEVR